VLEKPLKGARKGLNTIRKMGYKVVIHTSRPSAHYKNIEDWLVKNNLPFDRIVTGKELCVMYIDDRGFRLENWEKDIKGIVGVLKSK